MVLKYGLGAVALREIWMLRGEVRKGFADVATALKGHEAKIEDHEERLRAIEGDFPWSSS